MEEKIICEVSPSQILNLKSFIYSFLAIGIIVAAAIISGENLVFLALILPIGYAFWKYLQIASTKLKITDERLILREGVLNKSTNETELYRVRDSSIQEPFFYRIFGCGNALPSFSSRFHSASPYGRTMIANQHRAVWHITVFCDCDHRAFAANCID